MKVKSLFIMLLFVLSGLVTKAQHVSIRLDFPIGVRVGPPGPPPFHGAVWIGPEWVWRNGRYVYVQGYWANPRGKSMWAPGHWKKHKKGYYWVPGYWK